VATNSSDKPDSYSATVPVRAPSTAKVPCVLVAAPPVNQAVANQSTGRLGPLKSITLALTGIAGVALSTAMRIVKSRGGFAAMWEPCQVLAHSQQVQFVIQWLSLQ